MKKSRRVKTGVLLQKGSLRRTQDATHRDVILKDKIRSRALHGVREHTAGDDVIFIFVLLLSEIVQIPESARCA